MSPQRSTLTSLLASSLGLFIMLAEGPSPVNAHMRLTHPAPLRGENNPQYDWSGYDYSMTNPLLEDGSNFACKGYQQDVPGKSQAVETIKAGQQYEVTLDGSAVHGGGSCQFSLSYDGGNTFGVVHSVIGGCPIEKKYSFKIPANVPAGKNVLLAWTWFNKVGNREMYMNCAAVDIESSSTSSIKLPSIFRANTFAGTCSTVEGDEIVFPNPGDSVVYGGMWAGQKPGQNALKTTGCSDDQMNVNKIVTLVSNTGAAPDNGNGGGKDEPAPQPTIVEPVKTPEPTPSSTTQKPVKVPSPTSTKVSLRPGRGGAASSSATISSSSVVVPVTPTISSVASLSSGRGNPKTKTTSSPAAIETPTLPDNGVCTGTGMKCSEDGGSFYICGSGQWISMGLVAPGTVCKNGKIVVASSSPESCSPGAMVCSQDGTSFSMCTAEGALINMGLVAPGTQCVDGKIGLAAKKSNKTKRHGPRRLSHSS